MRRFLIAAICSTLLPLSTARAADTIPDKRLDELKEATVCVVAQNGNRSTGFIFLMDDETALVATAHCQPSPKFSVIVRPGTKQEKNLPAKIVAADPKADLAVLKVESKDLPKPLALSQRGEPREAMTVYALGVTLADSGTNSVSVDKSNIATVKQDPIIGEKVIALGGNLDLVYAGGPVIDSDGKLVGIASTSGAETKVNACAPLSALTAMVHGRIDAEAIELKLVRAGKVSSVQVDVYLHDPMKKIKEVKVRYVRKDDLKKEPAQDAPLPSSEVIDLNVDGETAVGQIGLKKDQKPADGYWVQAIYVNSVGKTIVLAPVVRTVTSGNPLVEGTHDNTSMPALIRSPRFEGTKLEIQIGPYDNLCTGGGGRFLVFHPKGKDKLAIFDVSEARVVKEIELTSKDGLFTCGRDKLMIVYPREGLIQRWSLTKFERESTEQVPAIHTSPVRVARLGSNSPGPLLLSSNSVTSLFDIQKMEPVKITEGTVGGDHISADGQTFVGDMQVSRLEGSKMKSIGDVPHQQFNGRWALPSADGGLVFSFAGGTTIQRVGTKLVEQTAPKDSRFFPTEDPRFFLALQNQDNDHNQVAIHTCGDLNRILTVPDIEKMPTGGAGAQWGLFAGQEPRIRYLPSANILLTLPSTDDRIVLRKFDLLGDLDQTGVKYLFVTSLPKTRVKAGTEYTYAIQAQSKAGGLRYELQVKPEGMTITKTGVVRWQVPEGAKSKSERVIINVTDKSGKELQHAFEVTIE